MKDVGEERRFDEKLVGPRGAENQRPAVERPPLQPQASQLDEIDRGDLVALPEEELISGERSSFERVLVECQHHRESGKLGAQPTVPCSDTAPCPRSDCTTARARHGAASSPRAPLPSSVRMLHPGLVAAKLGVALSLRRRQHVEREQMVFEMRAPE